MFVEIFSYSLGLTFLFELITVSARIFFNLKSAPIQRSLGMPRIHHGYVGALLLVVYFLVREPWIAILGLALILSDLAHHVVVLPFLESFQLDITSAHHHQTRRILIGVWSVLLIAGVVVLTTQL